MEVKEYLSLYGAEGEVTTRRVVRHLALTSLSQVYKMSGKMSLLGRNRIQFIYLHHIFQNEEAAFRRLLRYLSDAHVLISYSGAVEKLWRGDIDRPYVCLSFDDGLKNCLRAAKVMQEFGLSGCFFICPSIIGETNFAKLQEFCVLRLTLPATEMLDWREVETLLKNGHEIGSHTMSHQVLSRASAAQMQDEIAGSYEYLTRRLGSVKHFAWPEGSFLHFSEAAAKAVFDAGFQSCASAERGCHTVKPETRRSLCIRRDYISAHWPLNHGAYFLATNSQKASANCNNWPQAWEV